jgi:hypothetical protein
MQIKFEAKELKKAKKHVTRLTDVEEELEKKKKSFFLKDLLKFLFK